MNYIHRIQQFWQKDIQYRFTDKETALYFYLLHTCNALRWKQEFGIPNKLLYAKFGWGRQALANARQKLEEANLITSKQGQGRGNIYTYTLATTINTKQKTSNHGTPATEQKMPHPSERFAEQWKKLTQMPKWKEKPRAILQANLEKLKQYDEAFAIQLIEQTILGNWQGMVFGDTDTQYEKWKKQHQEQHENDNTAHNRKSEIIRRAAIAAAKCDS